MISNFTFLDKNIIIKTLPFVLKLSSKENMIFLKFKNADTLTYKNQIWQRQCFCRK
jgi:hypothetical protein